MGCPRYVKRKPDKAGEALFEIKNFLWSWPPPGVTTPPELSSLVQLQAHVFSSLLALALSCDSSSMRIIVFPAFLGQFPPLSDFNTEIDFWR